MERDWCSAQAAILPGREETNTADAQFSDIVREHQSMVYSLAFHFLRDRATSEEVAQEAFLRLYRNLDSIESRKHLVRWLRKVVWRLCIDETRRKPPGRHVSLDEVAVPAAPANDPDILLADRLRKMVADLPENIRMTVILRYQEDLDPMEIAQVLDVPVNTIKSRLQRTLVLLREKLGQSLKGVEP